MRALWLTMAALAAGCGVGGPAGGGIQITASGEVLALGGYSFPPANADEPAFVDGWELRFDKVLVTIDHLTFSESPDTSPTDQSQTGRRVAQLDGPWAIDLHRGGPLGGKGGSDEQAYPIAIVERQSLAGDAPFDSTLRYAFGYDIVPASAAATRLQIDAGDPDYAEMVQRGWTMLYVGTATWKGGECSSTDPSFDFGKLPSAVSFRLGFSTPTSYLNCLNPDNDPAHGLGDEEHQRGIQVKANQKVIAQVTVHTDHPFWDTFRHDAAVPHFDPLAALARPDAQGVHRLTLDSAAGVNYRAFKLGGKPLPWRACLPRYPLPSSSSDVELDALNVAHNPSGDPTHVLRDYRDYLDYAESTAGHFNSDGLCFVKRNYPSPP
jgi:hypothetical protein